MAFGIIVRRSRLGRPWWVSGLAPITAVAPNVDLPNYTSYSPLTDLVTINAGSTMHRPYDPPAVEGINDLGDLGSRASNQSAMQARYDALAASDSAATLQLTASADYGQLVLRSRPSGSAAGPIYVVSNQRGSLPSVSDGRLSGTSAQRVRPSDAPNMYRLRIASGLIFPFPLYQQQGAQGVSRVVIDGADIAPDGGFSVNHLINLHPGSGLTTDPNNYATYIELRRTYVHGITTLNTNGVQVACRFEVGHGKVNDCYFGNIALDAESKCLLTIANPLGGYSCQNTFLQSLGESWFVGGGDPYISGSPQVPTDIFYDRVHSHRPYTWNSKHPLLVPGTVSNDNKNGGEIKFVDRMCIQRYVVENCWCCGQSGVAFVLKCENQQPPNDVSTVYTRNVCLRHFMFFNVNRGFGGAGLIGDQGQDYVDIEQSRPTNIDIHSGVVALGNAVDYDIGKNVNHVMINLGDYFKDMRMKRITCLSQDINYTPFLFGGNRGSDNVLVEDVLMQGGNFSGSSASSYKRTGTQTPVVSNDGDDIINLNVRNNTWRRNGIFQPPGTGTYTAAQLTSIQNRHTLVLNTPTANVIPGYNPLDPAGSDYTVTHGSFTTAGENGTALGADWSWLSQQLVGVRN